MRRWATTILLVCVQALGTGDVNPVCHKTGVAAAPPTSYYVGSGIYHGVYDKTLALLPMAIDLRGRITWHLAPMYDGGTLLDLGCGTGRIGKTVAQAYPRTDLHGVDFSPDMAKVAVENGYPPGN